MGAKSEATQAVESVVGELREAKRHAEKNPGIPFMTEEVDKRTAKNRLTAMSPRDREQFIKKNGINKVMEILK
jgi:hypothetical protein